MTQTVVLGPDGVPVSVSDDSPRSPVASGAQAINGALTVVGTLTASAGMVATGRSRYSTIPIGAVAYGSLGTDGVMVAGTIYVADIFIPRNITLTGIGMLQGTTSATDKYIYALFGSAGGAALVTTALAGVVADGGTDAFQEIAFTATYAAIGPARYFIGIQCNGTSTKNRKVAAATYIDVLSKSYTGAFGTIGALTVPTTFVATTAPIAYVY